MSHSASGGLLLRTIQTAAGPFMTQHLGRLTAAATSASAMMISRVGAHRYRVELRKKAGVGGVLRFGRCV